MTQARTSEAALSVRHLSKNFAAVRALRDADLAVNRGELHALAGGNGSGKSTMVKILAGVEHGEPGGEIEVNGEVMAAEHMTASHSRRLGLHFVHQDPGLFLHLSVADNLALGQHYETDVTGRIRRSAMHRRARDVLERFEIDARPEQLVGELSAGRRSMIAIARALQDTKPEAGRHDVLVLDEATAALPEREAEQLLAQMRRFARSGQTVIYVTHRLDEIVGVADHVTVLRDGQTIASRSGDGLTESDLIALITGRPVADVFPQMPEPSVNEMLLSVRDLRGGRLQGVNLDLAEGEVLGVAGLLGSGRTSLLRALFGDLSITSGTIRYRGKNVLIGSPTVAAKHGIAYVAEDRNGDSAFPDLSIRENLLVGSVPRYFKRMHMSAKQERTDADKLITLFGIKADDATLPLSSLSGGNQQKVVLARWLKDRPDLLLLDEPTQGVDVGARADIYAMIRDAVAQGASVLLVAADHEELARVSDRVIVMRRGRVVAEINRPDITADRLTELTLVGEEQKR